MVAAERTYTIPLRKEILKAPKYKRAKKAVSAVREFVIRHSKSSEVRIGKHLNKKLWQQGIKNPPHIIKVDAVKDDKGTIMVELFGAPKEVKKEAPKKKAETPAEKVAEKMESIKPGKKTIEAKTEEKTAVEETKKSEEVKKEAEVTATAAPKEEKEKVEESSKKEEKTEGKEATTTSTNNKQ